MNAPELHALLTQYQRDALRTALKTETSRDLLIRTCGLAGEWGEFLAETIDETSDPKKCGEELADCFWYMASIAEVAGFQLADLIMLNAYNEPLSSIRVTIEIGKVAEYVKKTAGHGREKPIEDLTVPLSKILHSLIFKARDGLPEILAANVAKLRARHANAGPGGFDPNYGKPAAPQGCGCFAVHTCGIRDA